ncbi:MAG: hypothetical protein PVI81_07730 [Anaerolineales bacterium]|jgi:hypothetical protein
MNRDWLRPVVEATASWFDDSVRFEEYEVFMQRGVERLGRALRVPDDQPDWAGEFRLALNNLEKTGISLLEPRGLSAAPSLSLPEFQHSMAWIEGNSRSIVAKGTVERSTASHLLSLLVHSGQADRYDLKPMLETLLRHIELRRKRCLQLREGGTPTDRWLELDNTAILMARAARIFNDLRYLNAALKLIDWALPVHRRSVPAELLSRYMLALSEVHASLEVLV